MRYFFILSLILFYGCTNSRDHTRSYVISQAQLVPEDEETAEE